MAAKNSFASWKIIHSCEGFGGAWRVRRFKLVVSKLGFCPNKFSHKSICLSATAEGAEHLSQQECSFRARTMPFTMPSTKRKTSTNPYLRKCKGLPQRLVRRLLNLSQNLLSSSRLKFRRWLHLWNAARFSKSRKWSFFSFVWSCHETSMQTLGLNFSPFILPDLVRDSNDSFRLKSDLP